MCGIVGYIGKKQVLSTLIDGLKRLEYRGYDSSGIAIQQNGELQYAKTKGKIKALEDRISDRVFSGSVGIAHTRWATHGAVNQINAHPQLSFNKKISVVHNGILENYKSLKEELEVKGYKFISDTDTEIVAHLLDYYLEDDFFKTIQKVLNRVNGSYALGILNAEYPDTIFCARKDSPLVVGLGKDENFIASDVPALLKYTKDVYFLEDGEIGIIKKDSIEIFDIEKNQIDKKVTTIEWSLEQATKAGYPHFMLKEIFEQPEGIRDL